jgi:hypothetical protein
LEEAAGILVRGGTMREQESQAIILKDAMTRARRVAAERDPAAAALTVDTPVPFRISDLIRFVDATAQDFPEPLIPNTAKCSLKSSSTATNASRAGSS